VARIVGDADGYTFYLKQANGRYNQEAAIFLPSVTKVIKGTLASQALLYWNYSQTRDNIAGAIDHYAKQEDLPLEEFFDTFGDADNLEEYLKENRLRPTDVRDDAGERGRSADDLLNALADCQIADRSDEDLAGCTLDNDDATPWQRGVATWWLERQPVVVDSQRVVFSLEPHGGYAGSLDLLYSDEDGLCLMDLKTRKEGSRWLEQPYESEEIQVAAYDAAWTRMFGRSVDRRSILIVGAEGQYTEAPAVMPPAAFFHLLAVYQMIKARG
jgi:hypothetical protein